MLQACRKAAPVEMGSSPLEQRVDFAFRCQLEDCVEHQIRRDRGVSHGHSILDSDRLSWLKAVQVKGPVGSRLAKYYSDVESSARSVIESRCKWNSPSNEGVWVNWGSGSGRRPPVPPFAFAHGPGSKLTSECRRVHPLELRSRFRRTRNQI